MTDRQGDLLGAIHAAPDDDAPRLIFAGWLEDNGEPERGKFIRTQVEMKQERERNERISPRLDELFLVEKRLFSLPWANFARQMHAGVLGNFSRGFPDHVEVTGDKFRHHSRRIGLWLGPHTRVTLSGCHGKMKAIGNLASFRFVRRLEIKDPAVTDLDLVDLFSSPFVSGLREFPTGCRQLLSERVVQAITSADSTTCLRRLDLSRVHLTVDNFKAISNASHLSSLKRLDLSGTGLNRERIQALIGSPFLNALTELIVFDNHLGESELRLLFDRFGRGAVYPGPIRPEDVTSFEAQVDLD